jgi:integrase
MYFSLHKTPKSIYYHVAYRDGTGKRTLRSTREISIQKAKIKAEAMVQLAEAERRGETDRRFFDQLVSESLRRLGHESDPVPTAYRFFKDWLVEVKSTVSHATHRKYTSVIDQFLRSLGDKAYKRLTDVNSQDISRFRDSLLRSGLAPRTVNSSARIILKIPFKHAVDSGLLARNPVNLVKPIRAAAVQREGFSEAQVSALLRVAEPEWYGLVLFGWFTGTRLGDLSQLRWDQIDLEQGIVTFVARKTRRKAVVPLHDQLLGWLRAQDRRGGPIFRELSECDTSGSHGLSYQFVKLMARAGIVREMTPAEGAGRSTSNLSFHSLRHGFVSSLMNRSVSADIRKLLVGHRTDAVHSIYSHRTVELMRSGINVLPSIG